MPLMPDQKPTLDYATPKRRRHLFPWVPDSIVETSLYLLVLLVIVLLFRPRL
jgi:hypothetical protein